LTRKLTAAVTSVKKVLIAVSRLVETGHRVHFEERGGYIENLKDGSRIPMVLKRGVYVIKLRVRRPRGAATWLAPLSGGTWLAAWP
jgi:hypothetical protein